MALPVVASVGALAASVAPLTPPFPTSPAIAIDDALVFAVKTFGGDPPPPTIANQAGGVWVPAGPTNGSNANNGVRLTVFTSRYNGTQTAPTTTDTGDHQAGLIIAVRGCDWVSGTAVNAVLGDAGTFAEISTTIPAVTTTINNCLILDIIAGALPDVDGSGNYTTWTNAALASMTEVVDVSTSVGLGGSLAIHSGTKATAGSTGVTTVGHASWHAASKKLALVGSFTPPASGFGTDTSVTPHRATFDGATFFPLIAYDSGALSNFADISVEMLDLGRYGFTTYLNYQYGPLSTVLPQTTPLVPLGMHAIATGNSVTSFPALTTPTTAPTATSGAAGNVNVGTHSYKVTFTILSGQSSYTGVSLTLSAVSGTGVTVTATGGTPFVLNDVGRQVWSGAGRALIMAVVSSTVLTVNVLVAFSSTSIPVNPTTNASTFTLQGVQTNVGPASSVVTVATSAKQINLTNIPLGVPGTLGRKIYRTVAGDTGTYKLVMYLFNNTATTATDNVADASLGADAPGFSSTFAIIDNPLVSGVPFREHWNTRPGAGAFYITDEPQAQASGYGVYENAVYWYGVAAAEMPNVPAFSALFPEGPLVPETFAGSGVESQFGGVGFTEHLLSVANPYWWARNLPPAHPGGDWFGDDIYVNFRNETDPAQMGAQNGFPRFLVADRAAFSVAAASQHGRIPVLTLQYFGPFQQGRFPNNEETWADAIMAVAEGIRGIAWWQIGVNLGLRSQVDPLFTQATNTIIALTNFLKTNTATLLSPPIPGWTNSTATGNALNWRKGILPTIAHACRVTSAGSGGRGLYTAELNALNAGVMQWSPMLDQSGNVRMRVFQKDASTYLVFAYNYHPSPTAGPVTFTAPQPIVTVTVINEGRTITPSGATWADPLGGASSLLQGPERPARIYQVSTSATPSSPILAAGGLSYALTGATTVLSKLAGPTMVGFVYRK